MEKTFDFDQNTPGVWTIFFHGGERVKQVHKFSTVCVHHQHAIIGLSVTHRADSPEWVILHASHHFTCKIAHQPCTHINSQLLPTVVSEMTYNVLMRTLNPAHSFIILPSFTKNIWGLMVWDFLTDQMGMPFLSPNQQCQNTEVQVITISRYL